MSHTFKIDMDYNPCNLSFRWRVPNVFPNWLMNYINENDIKDLIEKWQDKADESIGSSKKILFIGIGITIGMGFIFLIVAFEMNLYEWYWFWMLAFLIGPIMAVVGGCQLRQKLHNVKNEIEDEFGELKNKYPGLYFKFETKQRINTYYTTDNRGYRQQRVSTQSLYDIIIYEDSNNIGNIAGVQIPQNANVTITVNQPTNLNQPQIQQMQQPIQPIQQQQMQTIQPIQGNMDNNQGIAIATQATLPAYESRKEGDEANPLIGGNNDDELPVYTNQ
mmetsp:Transcript_27743/g.33877  ORF Transcript_27743/g.33877 Transcript_27743/m.33877 type:complete len:276 (-) Transcript_27743:30-857(-)